MWGIRASRLFDGTTDRLLREPTVLVRNGTIEAVIDAGPPPSEVEILDLGEVTLLPGLIDAHVHLAFDAGPDVVAGLVRADDDALLARMRAAAAACLDAGVTTVRDLGDRGFLTLRVRAETAADPRAGARILASGPPLTTAAGHCHFLGGAVRGVAEIRAAIRDRAARGVDVVKMVLSGGALTPATHPHEPQFSLVELRAAVDQAHRHGLPITGHCHAAAAVANAVAAGFDGIEHCTFVTADDVEVDPRLLTRMARAGTRVTLTLGAAPTGAVTRPRPDPRVPGIHAAIRAMSAAGVPLACASDAGCGPGKPHGAVAHSAEAAVRIGFAPLDALRAVTAGAARALGLPDRIGQVAPGFAADLLAVRGDPTTRITALREVAVVFRSGVRVR